MSMLNSPSAFKLSCLSFVTASCHSVKCQDYLPKQVKPRVSTSLNPNRSHNERWNDDEQRASASDEVEEEKRQPAPDSISSPNESLVQPPSFKMPTEVSDIKQFIEICRRKDASC